MLVLFGLGQGEGCYSVDNLHPNSNQGDPILYRQAFLCWCANTCGVNPDFVDMSTAPCERCSMGVPDTDPVLIPWQHKGSHLNLSKGL